MTGRRARRPAPSITHPAAPSAPPPEAQPLTAKQEALLALQQMAGNRAVGALLRRGGDRLPNETRQAMEARLGEDLSDVEVHTDPAAASQAQALGAQAYTAGADIGFADGTYAPGTPQGDQLLAHELAHVVQQKRAGVAADPRRITPAGHPSEQQAQAAARGQPTALNAAPVGVSLYAPGGQKDEQTAAPGAALAATPTAPTPEDPAAALERNIGLADTIARGYLDTHYNDVQDAIRDFVETASDQIEAMDGPPSKLWGLLALSDTVTSLVKDYFPLSRVGGVIVNVLNEASPVRSAIQTILTTKATNEADAAKRLAKQVVKTVGTQSGSIQAAAFKRAREALRGQLFSLASGSPQERSLLQLGNADAVVTEQLGIPAPGATSLYRKVRLELEYIFADWRTEQPYFAKGKGWLVSLGLHDDVYATGRKAARERVEADVEARAGMGSGLDAAIEQSFTFANEETDPVRGGAGLDTVGLDPEAETDLIVLESVKVAEARARNFMNSNYNAVQDALRDFTASAMNQIEAMPEEPADYALAHLLVETAATAISIIFPPSALVVTMGLALKTAVQTFSAAAEEQESLRGRQEALDSVRRFSRGMSNAQAAAFASGEQVLGAELTELALTDEGARTLLEIGSPEALDKVITDKLKLPHPERSDAYLKVREPLEVKFSEWYTLQTKVKRNMRQYGVGEHLLRPAREEARERARLDAQARSAMGLKIEPEDEAPLPPLTPMGPLTLEQSRKATALNQAIALIDTRARGFLNTHYDAVQDAIRDFDDSAQERLAEMEDSAANLGDLQTTLFGAAASKLSGAFGEDLVGETMSKALGVASTVASAVQSRAMAVAADREAKAGTKSKSAAKNVMQTLIKDMSNFQAAAFERGQQSVGRQLTRLIASDEGLRAQLEAFADQTESGQRLQIDAVIVNKLGIPNPETSPLYLKVRMALETEFFGWAARTVTEQHQYQYHWMRTYEIDSGIEQRSRTEAAKRAQKAAEQRGEG
jgi:hypothetical protein